MVGSHGPEAMLHKLNPVRLDMCRDQIDRHWRCDEHDRKPLAGKTALDVGCGAGLLAEPLARMGAEVTGLDASSELIEAARAHAAGQGLVIDYRAVELDRLDGRFDLITCMEVIEHVADPAASLALATRLAPGGFLVLSTPNATGWSRLLMITLGEGMGRIPRGTHDFGKFIAPERMKMLLAEAGLRSHRRRGDRLVADPRSPFERRRSPQLSGDGDPRSRLTRELRLAAINHVPRLTALTIVTPVPSVLSPCIGIHFWPGGQHCAHCSTSRRATWRSISARRTPSSTLEARASSPTSPRWSRWKR